MVYATMYDLTLQLVQFFTVYNDCVLLRQVRPTGLVTLSLSFPPSSIYIE
ncbi:MAG: hypothetical protein ACI8VC_000910 [Candidatus Endobugula sp.]|jgi:hypothetical protein